MCLDGIQTEDNLANYSFTYKLSSESPLINLEFFFIQLLQVTDPNSRYNTYTCFLRIWRDPSTSLSSTHGGVNIFLYSDAGKLSSVDGLESKVFLHSDFGLMS